MLKPCAVSPAAASFYDVRLHQADDLDAVVAWASGNGMTVLAASGHLFRMRATALHARALSELVAVASVEVWAPPTPILADHVARLSWRRRGARCAS